LSSEATLLFGETYHHPSIYWRTRFLAPDPIVYLETDEDRILLVSPMEVHRARVQGQIERVFSYEDFDFTAIQRGSSGSDDAYAQLIAAVLRRFSILRVRVEPDCPVSVARALERRDIEVVSSGPIFATEMRSKSAAEVEAIRSSQEAAENAMAVARDLLRHAEVRDGFLFRDGDALSSATLIGAIEAELLRRGCGADGTIAAGGRASANPHVADSGHLEADRPVIIDIFPQHKQTRYHGDITRTYVVGQPSQMWLRMYEAVRDAHRAALASLGAGVNGREVHLAVCAALYEAGFSSLVDDYRRPGTPEMIHGTGHGVGLLVHEAPRISDVDMELREGDVVTIEPGLYHPDHGGVRLEDTVLVTAGGYRNLTDYSMEWRP
jgi:Xaa-Pro aminopeptidase